MAEEKKERTAQATDKQADWFQQSLGFEGDPGENRQRLMRTLNILYKHGIGISFYLESRAVSLGEEEIIDGSPRWKEGGQKGYFILEAEANATVEEDGTLSLNGLGTRRGVGIKASYRPATLTISPEQVNLTIDGEEVINKTSLN